MSVEKITLPNLLLACPFKWSVNPHYERARNESQAWIEGLKAFTGRKRALFSIMNTELLAALAYPYADYDEMRTCCDYINLLFAIDEVTDEIDGSAAQEQGDIVIRAMNGKFTNGAILSKVAEEFMERFTKRATPKCQRRFLAHFANYVTAVSREARLRSDKVVMSVDSYMSLRRDNSAVQTCFALFDYVHGLDLPDAVFQDPVFLRMYWQGIDMVCLSNDLYSFSMERAKGLDGNNFVTVAMREKNMGMQEAVNHTGEEFMTQLNHFIEDRTRLRTFGGKVDEGVHKYLFSISQWIIGNIIWSFESPRYFGVHNNEVKRTLVVEVLNFGDDADAHLVD